MVASRNRSAHGNLNRLRTASTGAAVASTPAPSAPAAAVPAAGSTRSGCAINAAVEALGDQWSLIVLRDVMFGNRRHFRELVANSEEGIATNILSSRLKRLVAGGLLTRADAGPGRRATYSLTAAGIDVLPILVALGNWGLAHRDGDRSLRVRAELLRDGGPDLVAAMMDELRELHLGVPRPDPEAPRPSEQLHAAYEAALAEPRG